MGATDWLPSLVVFKDYGGNWNAYLEAIYGMFKKDFIDSKPDFFGRRMGLIRNPVSLGKEATFWHFISEGKVEDDRLPDFRRCERIKWPKPIIESADDGSKVKWWSDKRQTDTRILIALSDFTYIVVLLDKGNYLLPLTAYNIDKSHRQDKYRKEYEEFNKSSKKS